MHTEYASVGHVHFKPGPPRIFKPGQRSGIFKPGPKSSLGIFKPGQKLPREVVTRD